MEPLYKGHAGTMKIVLYREVSFIQRLNYTRKYCIGSKQERGVLYSNQSVLYGSTYCIVVENYTWLQYHYRCSKMREALFEFVIVVFLNLQKQNQKCIHCYKNTHIHAHGFLRRVCSIFSQELLHNVISATTYIYAFFITTKYMHSF